MMINSEFAFEKKLGVETDPIDTAVIGNKQFIL